MKKINLLLSVALLCGVTTLTLAQQQFDTEKVKQIILQDAQNQGIPKLPEVISALRNAQDAVIISAWEKKLLAEQPPVTQDMKMQVYKELAELLGDSEYVIYQAFLDNENSAQALINAMLANPKWNELNVKNIFPEKTKYSINQSDWVKITAILPEFRPVVKSLKKGEVAPKPVQARGGWHVVGLIELRPLVMPSADKIDKELQGLAERKIVGQKLQKMLEK